MNRSEFEQLRKLPNKVINSDIVYIEDSSEFPLFRFQGVQIENSLGLKLLLNGTYRPTINSIVFNFSVNGIGAICRLCVNGAIHKDVGRTHKHDLREEDDPRINLPTAIRREDLTGLTLEEVWTILCKQANITHNGSLKYPRIEC